MVFNVASERLKVGGVPHTVGPADVGVSGAAGPEAQLPPAEAENLQLAQDGAEAEQVGHHQHRLLPDSAGSGPGTEPALVDQVVLCSIATLW